MYQSTNSGLGSFVLREGVPYYKISQAQTLKPFFIQVASASDIWIFLSSKGGVTAGRKNAQFNLFPYETEDRLHSNYDTGSRTYIKIGKKIWQPFAQETSEFYSITQNIYKSYYGNAVVLEEINETLQISYSYTFCSSEKYGFVKTSNIANLGKNTENIEVLDGLMNICPHGVDPLLQATSSTLVDAYKAAELVNDNLAVYSLTTKINDTPNPIEILKANVAFHSLGKGSVYLSPEAISAFLSGSLSNLNSDCYGKKSAYFLHYAHELKDSLSYSFVLDSGFDHSAVTERLKFVKNGDFSYVTEDILKGTEELKTIVAEADGMQETADKVASAHHFLNTLYNVMRGGTFQKGYEIDSEDFIKFAEKRNKKSKENSQLLAKIKECQTIMDLKQVCSEDNLYYRLALEYLPLSFSRRHGDPSRPWNQFNINLKNEKGEKITSYEGNWRDIFQNWEALGLSYPAYYENMLSKFVNATTADGFNPYRINQEGIDWEKPEPENPFGGFGYWGDHQIVYLHRLLLGLQRHFPDKLQEMLSLDLFSYGNVPYILNNYDSILKNSKDTITFDFEKDEKIELLVQEIGTDGKLLLQGDSVYQVCLVEKLLVPLLSKASNLLVGGGIWMNTQRPEWNDANNAIVGIGLSMVTVYHLKSYLLFLLNLLENTENIEKSFQCSSLVVTWLQETSSAFTAFEQNYQGKEKELLNQLGASFSKYREILYKEGLKDKEELSLADILRYLRTVSCAIDETIARNKENQGVYATYNLLNSDFSVSPMSSMLEGQSAIIGSGMLSTTEVCDLLEAMNRELYQKDLKCHTLYPIKMTKRFIDKNKISTMKEEIPEILIKDASGTLHFHSDLVTLDLLQERCKNLKIQPEIQKLLEKEYENLFAHNAFTGRSQVMYKFEGIGCVYWHQNAKLALAVLETVQRAREISADSTDLYVKYKNLMSGFIYRKTPEECNAIPVEPYSHTSFSGQSEQAGMTGQVKESVIMRRGELGISVKQGEIHFDKWFLSPEELNESGECNASLYSIPATYQKISDLPIDNIKILMASGESKVYQGNKIPKTMSEQVFYRSNQVQSITFSFS